MSSTRKLPVGHDPKKPNRRVGHVVPKFTLGFAGDGFIAVDSTKEALVGRLVCLGRDVTSADVLKKVKSIHRLEISDTEALSRLDRFLAQLESLKIGFVIRCSTKEGMRLEVISEYSALSKPLPLP